METKARKWGNSIGVRLPKSVAQQAHVEDGTSVDVTVSEGVIQLRPVARAKYTLKELLSRIKPDNLHAEIDYGGSAEGELL